MDASAIMWAGRRGIACLVLGAAATVGVAWGSELCFLRAEPSPQMPAPMERDGWMWTVAQWSAPGRRTFVVMPIGSSTSAAARSVRMSRRQQAPTADVYPEWVPFPTDNQRVREVRALGFGWPLVALRSEVWTEVGASRPRLRGAVGEAPRAISRRSYPVGLSVWPVWPGLVVDTGLYAAVAAVPMFLWPAVRRRRWKREGLCSACGYERGGLPVCPECGRRAHQPPERTMGPACAPEPISPTGSPACHRAAAGV